MFLWPVLLVLGYYLAPLLGFWFWLRQIWALRSGWLRAFASAVIIIIIVSSLNTQVIPSHNPHWLMVLALALCVSHFLPNARPYLLATHLLLLSICLSLHLWYCYLSQRLLFDNQYSYYAAPCMALFFLLSLFMPNRQKRLWLRLGTIGLALVLGAAAGQYFYLNA
jgi:hypothetical protein